MNTTLEWIKKIQSKGFTLLLLPAVIVNLLVARLGPDAHHDALNSFHHIAKSGIIAFNDYGYGKNLEAYKTPAPAINFFLLTYKNEIEIIKSNYQVWIIKK